MRETSASTSRCEAEFTPFFIVLVPADFEFRYLSSSLRQSLRTANRMQMLSRRQAWRAILRQGCASVTAFCPGTARRPARASTWQRARWRRPCLPLPGCAAYRCAPLFPEMDPIMLRRSARYKTGETNRAPFATGFDRLLFHTRSGSRFPGIFDMSGRYGLAGYTGAASCAFGLLSLAAAARIL